MYCLCVNVYCHQVTTQLQLINISYHTFLEDFHTKTLYAVFVSPILAICPSNHLTRLGKYSYTFNDTHLPSDLTAKIMVCWSPRSLVARLS